MVTSRPEDRGDDEPGHPALVLHPELARPVDARLPERGGGDAVDPGEVERVLVGGALRAAIGRKEIERLGLADAVRPVAVGVAVAAQLGLGGRDLAVDLVGRCEDEDGFRTVHPHGIEHVEGAERIDGEIGARVGHGRRDRHLGRQMQHRVEPAFREDAVDGGLVAHVDLLEIEGRAVAQPDEVLVRPRPGEIVEYRYVPVPCPEVACRIAADEPGPARDQNPLGRHHPAERYALHRLLCTPRSSAPPRCQPCDS